MNKNTWDAEGAFGITWDDSRIQCFALAQDEIRCMQWVEHNRSQRAACIVKKIKDDLPTNAYHRLHELAELCFCTHRSNNHWRGEYVSKLVNQWTAMVKIAILKFRATQSACQNPPNILEQDATKFKPMRLLPLPRPNDVVFSVPAVHASAMNNLDVYQEAQSKADMRFWHSSASIKTEKDKQADEQLNAASSNPKASHDGVTFDAYFNSPLNPVQNGESHTEVQKSNAASPNITSEHKAEPPYPHLRSLLKNGQGGESVDKEADLFSTQFEAHSVTHNECYELTNNVKQLQLGEGAVDKEDKSLQSEITIGADTSSRLQRALNDANLREQYLEKEMRNERDMKKVLLKMVIILKLMKNKERAALEKAKDYSEALASNVEDEKHRALLLENELSNLNAIQEKTQLDLEKANETISDQAAVIMRRQKLFVKSCAILLTKAEKAEEMGKLLKERVNELEEAVEDSAKAADERQDQIDALEWLGE